MSVEVTSTSTRTRRVPEDEDEGPGPDGPTEEFDEEKSDSDSSDSGEELEDQEEEIEENAVEEASGGTQASRRIGRYASVTAHVIRDAFKAVVAVLGGVQDPVTKKKARRRTPNSAQSTMERLTSLGKFFMRAVSPYLDIGQAMLYGPEHHWSTPAAPDPSNTVVVPPAELERQKYAVKAFDKLFTASPDLLGVVKQLYLDIPENPDPWNKLVRVMRTAATSARTADTGGLKHCVNYLLPDPSKTPLVPPILKNESKSDRGLAHPMLRYFILPWKDRVLLPPLQLTPAAPNTACVPH
ncbi:hypothetical protein B0H11DRAFT_2191295 [Mycena galericulata]|nr:hypothetical protein B0H11DRAFT_2191295 [Mycena galericulata]